MALNGGWYAAELRRELGERSRLWAKGRAHVESYGNPPVVIYAPEPAAIDQAASGQTGEPSRHGNFFDASYAAIQARPDWLRRFDKIHAQERAIPQAETVGLSARRWRELDSSMSSDALLMNIFCDPGVGSCPSLRRALGVDAATLPQFGWRARVPLASGRFDRTEVDMRWGNLLVEAKLTENGFQTRAAAIVEGYRDFDAVFERELLPRVELRAARRRAAVEFAEDYTQEWEAPAADDSVAREFQAAIVARAREQEAVEPAYASYQLIRNVLAAYAEAASFCVLHDQRRPDLREAWYAVMAAVKPAEMRTRCKVLTWQELTGFLPEPLRDFLDLKYGIIPVGRVASAPSNSLVLD